MRMKMKLTLLLAACWISLFPSAVLSQTNTQAQENPVEIPELDEVAVRNIAARICLAMTIARSDDVVADEIGPRIESIIYTYSDIDPSTDPDKKRLVGVWNKYAPAMICSATGGVWPTQHVYKRAIAMNVNQGVLVGYFMQGAERYPFDMNAMEMYAEGTGTTLLNYIDLILAHPDADNRYNVGQIKRLRNLLVRRFDGKRADEMSEKELERRKAEFLRLKSENYIK